MEKKKNSKSAALVIGLIVLFNIISTTIQEGSIFALIPLVFFLVIIVIIISKVKNLVPPEKRAEFKRRMEEEQKNNYTPQQYQDIFKDLFRSSSAGQTVKSTGIPDSIKTSDIPQAPVNPMIDQENIGLKLILIILAISVIFGVIFLYNNPQFISIIAEKLNS